MSHVRFTGQLIKHFLKLKKIIKKAKKKPKI